MATTGAKLAPSPISRPLDLSTGPKSADFPKAASTSRLSLFVIADLCCVLSAAFLAIALRFPDTGTPYRSRMLVPEHVSITFLYAAIIVLFCHTQNLYSAYQSSSWSTEFTAVTKAVFLATGLLAGTMFVTGVKTTSRLIVASTGISAIVTMTTWRQVRRRRLKKAVADGLSCHNLLIVGTDHVARAVAQHLALHRQFGFVVVGHLRPSEPHLASGNFDDLKVLGSVDELKGLCRTHFIDEILVCSHHRRTVMQVISDAREAGVGVHVVPDLYDGLAWGARMDYLGDLPTLAVVSRSIPAVAIMFKRIFDFAAAFFGLLFISPLLALIAIAVKLDSSGPVLYASQRVGKKGRVFSCLKFRTMVVNAEELKEKLVHLNERDGILFKITEDPRVTRVGRFLRKHSLDELPQLLNVLRGDMSLVGPRPPLISEVKKYQLDYLRRLEVAPGITGLWQVEARNNPSFDTYISLDLQYIENWSLALDLNILLRTACVVLGGTGK